MSLNSGFTAAEDESQLPLTLEECRRRLQNPDLPRQEAILVWRRQGVLLRQIGQFQEAIASFEQALHLRPDDSATYYQQALTLQAMGQPEAAIASFDQAIRCDPAHSAQIWRDRGDLLRGLGRYAKALESYEKTLALNPEDYGALASQGAMLAVLGRRRAALASCDRAMKLQPDAAEVWNSRGIVLMIAGRHRDALHHFDHALDLQPDYDKAWCNRAITLLRLGREQEAATCFERALSFPTDENEVWRTTAWAGHAFVMLKLGRFEAAIASCDEAIALKPNSYSAALYRVVCLLLSGQLFHHLLKADQRQVLLSNLKTIVGFLKYRLLGLVALLGLLTYGEGNWIEFIRQGIPIVMSIAIIVVVGVDLWRNKTKLNFVWETYFRNGLLPYVRALGIITATLTTYAIADSFVPPFMRWGWANLVFGEPGNILFQPFNLIDSSAPASSHFAAQVSNLIGAFPVLLAKQGLMGAVMAWLGTKNVASPVDYASIFVVSFWFLLLLGIPFWARLEERIFRQGANTWRQISIRSTQFGLVHLLAGIPLVGGFVLIVPGFLFACRYKYVYERWLKATADPQHAQEAGVLASTADHAAYNALLVTFITATLLWV